ncbi:hypothetical protein Bbelb_412670 [Branchiostoma belcheri]|nr:hypothetical protein Bbelb_412670 [Branchiostoma belcheri]
MVERQSAKKPYDTQSSWSSPHSTVSGRDDRRFGYQKLTSYEIDQTVERLHSGRRLIPLYRRAEEPAAPEGQFGPGAGEPDHREADPRRLRQGDGPEKGPRRTHAEHGHGQLVRLEGVELTTKILSKQMFGLFWTF